jgi:hypothetical protein
MSEDSRPIPDPTLLTTQQLYREVIQLRELIEARLDGMDRATELIRLAASEVEKTTDSKVDHLRELTDAKLSSLLEKFADRDERTEQRWSDSKQALDAALQAAEKAVGKSEAASLKQMEQLHGLVNSQKDATDRRIDELRGRQDKSEGLLGGHKDEKQAGQNTFNMALAFVTMIAVIVAAIAAVVALSSHGH